MHKNILIGAGVLIALIILASTLSLSTSGFIGEHPSTFKISSISTTTDYITNKPMILISGISGQGSDLVQTTLDKSVSGFTSNKRFDMTIYTISNDVIYTANDRSGVDGQIFGPTLRASCGQTGEKSCAEDYGLFGASMFEYFKSECSRLHGTPYNRATLAADLGTLGAPVYKCYSYDPKWIISTFTATGLTTKPEVGVSITETTENGAMSEFFTTLTNTQAQQITINGQNYGDVRITQMGQQLTSPPNAAGVEMIRTADLASTKYLVDSGVYQRWIYYNDQFNGQLQSCKTTGINFITSQIGLILSGGFNRNCFDNAIYTYTANLNRLSSDRVWTEINKVDISDLQSTKTFSIENKYSVPIVDIRIFSDKAGITSVLAKPQYCTLGKVNLGAQNTQNIPYSVQTAYTGASGVLSWGLTCNSPFSPLISSGNTPPIASGDGYSSTLQINTGATASTSSCTLRITDANGGNAITCSQTYTKAPECNLAIPQGSGFIINLNTNPCSLECPASFTCSAGKTKDTNTCTCISSTTPPPCTPQTCTNGASWSSDLCACIGGSSGSNTTACLPIIQKQKVEYQGAIFGIGGTPVYSCENDLIGLGIIVIALLGIGIIIKKKRF